MSTPPSPLCFVAMPYGKRAASPGGPEIDFNAVFEDLFKPPVLAAGLECVRADFELSGGFVHKPMFERLIVAEYVLADVTFANPNVTYELGLRHGASLGATLLVAEAKYIQDKKLPFDLAPFRVLPYSVDAGGRPDPAQIQTFKRELGERLTLARRGELPNDNPVVQLTQLRPTTTGHEKTELFLARMEYASDIARRASEAIVRADKAQGLAELEALENEALARGPDLRELHTSLLAVYLGYRAKEAYERMIALFGRMPPELRETAVAREQLGLALNRTAEAAAKKGDPGLAGERRASALAAIKAIAQERWTSETYGILGRIHKGQGDAELAAANTAKDEGAAQNHRNQADAAFSAAIEAYEHGFRSDPRDYWPGVNAVTLRIVRNDEEDAEALETLVRVVRFSADRAPEPKTAEERYWLNATKLELAAAERDWRGTKQALRQLLATTVTQDFMRKTTCKNLKLQAAARKGEPETVKQLESIIVALGGGE